MTEFKGSSNLKTRSPILKSCSWEICRATSLKTTLSLNLNKQERLHVVFDGPPIQLESASSFDDAEHIMSST